MNIFFVLLGTVMLLSKTASAQTCSVNAGVDRSICSKGVMTLQGNGTAPFAVNPRWRMISGPNTPTITSPGSAVTTVTGFIPGTYVFQYYGKCSDKVDVSDNVTITVDAAPVFTAGNDTFVCGLATKLNATLPAGASGTWFSSVLSNVSAGTFANTTVKNTDLSVSAPDGSCSKKLQVIWRVSKGACTLRDTAVITFGGQSSSFALIPDASMCGTSYTTPVYNVGCGGTLSATEISGPTAAAISYGAASGSSSNSATFSGLVMGTYTFATQIFKCDGTAFRDTFNITITNTVAVTNPVVNNIDICINNFDTTYFLTPTVNLLPGETLIWNTTPGKDPGSLPSPVATVSGNTLKISSVTHPDTFSATGYYQYAYNYSVSNGICTIPYTAYLTLRTPMKKAIFKPVLNLECSIDTAVINQLISGPPGLSYDSVKVLGKPAGAGSPFISMPSGKIVVKDLAPGKYTFSFRYTQGTCEYKTQIVDVHVSAPTGLSNAGTDQRLPCNATSTVLAGNTPDIGETGTWHLISGPTAATLTTPNSPSLAVSGLAVGVYQFRWIISGGSGCASNSDDVNVIVFTSTPAADAGPDKTVCAGNIVSLNGNATTIGVTGRWKQVSGLSVTIADTTASTTSFSGTTVDTFYKFVWSLTNVCGTTTDTVTITTNPTLGPSPANIKTPNTCLTASSSMTLFAFNPSRGTGTWSQVDGPGTATIASPSDTSTLVSDLTDGTYKFVWTVSDGVCDDQTDTITISYRSTTLTANAGPDQNVCSMSSVTMAATAPSPSGIIGTWTQIAGPGSTITSPNDVNTTITGLVEGNAYDYRWTVSAGAQSVCPSTSDVVHIIISNQPSAAAAMPDVVTCGSIGGLTTITATAPTVGTGSWSSVLESPIGYPTVITNPALNNTTATINRGVTKLVWQVSSSFGGACPTNYDTVRFEIIPTPSAGTDFIGCALTNTTLNGTAFGSGSAAWTQVSGPTTVVFTQLNSQRTVVTGLTPGVYEFKYTVTHPTCGGSGIIKLTNYGKPVANAGPNASYCWVPPNVTFALTGDTTGGYASSVTTVAWSRVLGTGTVSYSPNATVLSPSATVDNFGLQQFLMTVTNPGCTVKDYVDVFIDKPTILSFNLTPRSACNDTFAITASVPVDGYSYLWEFPTGLIPTVSGIDKRGPIENSFTKKGNNKVYLTLTNTTTGCTFKDSTTIFVCKSVIPPIANNITAVPMNSSNGSTPIPELKASNPSGTEIKTYNVLTLPPASQGVLYYCASAPAVCAPGSLTAVSVSTALTPDQSKSLYFDPAANFTGNVQFTYQATDTNDLVSNVATYTIPVFNTPPVTENIRTALINRNDGPTLIPSLISGDADGTVDSFILSSIPPASQGVLSYCSNGTEPCTGSVITISDITTLSPAQMLTLKFDPAFTYIGDYVFEYQSKDNNGNISNTSTYTIPVSDIWIQLTPYPPVAVNIIAQNINNTAGPTPIPNLQGTDPDGTINHYQIGNSVPDATQGTLYYCASAPAACTAGTLTAVVAGQTLSPAQAQSLQFDPVPGFIGNANFTYTAIDNDGVPLTSNPATYTIPVVNMPPVANPSSISPVVNTKTTPTLLPPLSGYDVDGTVVSYNIVDVPPFNQGVLKYCATAPGTPCTPSTMSLITAAITGLTPEQIATITFTPNVNYIGQYVFHFSTVDNNGQESQPAAFTIPVIAFPLVTGEPPIAYSFNNPTINSSSSALLTTALSGTDPDGTVVSYTVTTITPASEGILTYCVTPPSGGCGTAVTPGMVMTPAQAATILFTPNANFTGVATFNYTNTDNDGNVSNTATVTIPVTNNPPISKNISNSPISRLSTDPAVLNPLSSTDADGTVVSYKILTIPTAEEGVLKLCVTPPATGCTPVSPGQIISAADADKLTFTPNPGVHSPVVTFLYSSIDNSGNSSNVAAVTIPFIDAHILPVALINFNAYKKGADALLQWKVGVEQNLSAYVLQHSTDGSLWKEIDQQKPQNMNNYEFLHKNVARGNNYYRLKLVDNEKAYTYSPVRTLYFDHSSGYNITVQPNPVTNNVYISSSDNAVLGEVSIYSVEGKKIQSIGQMNSGSSISMSQYPSGFYLIKIIDKNGETQSIKISKN